MAAPHLENGYTPIANELLGQVYKLKLNGTQFKIIMCVWRYTYGFSRDNHDLSETFISKAIQVHKKQVSRELNELIKYNIIIVQKAATFTESRVVSFNKNYDNWYLNSGEVTKTFPPNELVNATGSELVGSTGSGLVGSTGSGLAPQENNNKTNIKQYIDIVDTDKSAPTIPKFLDDSFEINIVNTIIKSCQEILPNSKVPSTPKEKDKWAMEIDRMKRIDKRTEEEIEQALQYAIGSGFWKTNIRSTKKLREKYETLIIQSKQDKTKYSKKEEVNTTYGENYDTGNAYTLEYYDQFRTTE